MKRIAIVALVLLAGGLTTHEAQAQIYGQSFGEIYLVNDVAADPMTANCNDNATDPINPFQQFSWFLVVKIDFADIGLGNQNGSNGIQAWEASVSIPDEITVTGSTFNPPGSVNVGVPGDPNDSNWIVGTGTIITAASTPIQVVSYNGLLLAAATNLELSIGGTAPSSFTQPGGPGVVPGWVEWNETGECPSHCLRAFAKWRACEQTFMINYDEPGRDCFGATTGRCMVATESTTWGNLKSRF